jgi:hypothetical protein
VKLVLSNTAEEIMPAASSPALRSRPNRLAAPLSTVGVDVRPILIVFGQAQILSQPTSILSVILVIPVHLLLLTEID